MRMRVLWVAIDNEYPFIEDAVNCTDIGIIDFEAEGKKFDDPCYVLVLTSKPDLKSHRECISSKDLPFDVRSITIFSFTSKKTTKSATSIFIEVNTIVSVLRCSSVQQQHALITNLNDGFGTLPASSYDVPILALPLDQVQFVGAISQPIPAEFVSLFADFAHSLSALPSSSCLQLPCCAVCLRRLRFCPSAIALGRSFVSSPYSSSSSSSSVRCELCLLLWQANNSHPASTSNTSISSLLACHGQYLTAEDNTWHECGLQLNLWVCLACASVGCGRYSRRHAVDHHLLLPGHRLALELATGRIWDYEADDYYHYSEEQLAVGMTKLTLPSSNTGVATGVATGAGNNEWVMAIEQLTLLRQQHAVETGVDFTVDCPRLLLSCSTGTGAASSSSAAAAAGSFSPPATNGAATSYYPVPPPSYPIHQQQQQQQQQQSQEQVLADKISSVAAEFERLLESAAAEQQLHFDKLLARETVRALEAQLLQQQGSSSLSSSSLSHATAAPSNNTAAATHKKKKINLPSSSPSSPFAAITDEDEEERERERRLDEALREIEASKLAVSAAEAEVLSLQRSLVEANGDLRRAKARCELQLQRQARLVAEEQRLTLQEEAAKMDAAAQVDELQQQIRDLSFFVNSRNMTEISGGQVQGVAGGGGSTSNGSKSSNTNSGSKGRK